jgi:PAS domain-containing protein
MNPRVSRSSALASKATGFPIAKIAAKLVRTFTDRHGLKDLCRELLGVDLSKQQQTSDWGAAELTTEQMAYAASDVLHLHALWAKLEGLLKREGRLDLAEACFRFLPARGRLDLLGYEDAAQFFREDGMARMFRGRARDTLQDSNELHIFNRDGTPVALEARIRKVEWDNAPATLMTFRTADAGGVTERIRELEGELRSAESGMRELHAILDTATDGVIVLDNEGRVLSMNRSAEALFGLDTAQIAGIYTYSIVHADDCIEHATQAQKML